MPFYPPLRFPTPRNRRAQAALRTIDDVVFEIINARRSTPGEEIKDDLLAMLMEARDEGDGKGMTDQQLRDETLIMFAAGHETTANAMAWAFYLLDRHPEVFTKLRAEVETVLDGRAPAFCILPIRRRGLARAQVSRSRQAQKPAGMTESALAADAGSANAVSSLYESCGFVIEATDIFY